MSENLEHYEDLWSDAGMDDESLTCVVVAGASRELVAEALGVDLSTPQDPGDVDDENHSAYAVAEIAGGVVAIENSGYADPSVAALARLSADGRSAAVVRSNIQAHTRFGCASDGVVLFDAHEFTFVDDKDRVPAELRSLFDLAWVDPDDEDGDGEEDAMAVGMAMAEVVTGLRVTSDDLQRVWESGFFRVPSLTYIGGSD